ncbi:MAG TPA: alcohol dehydrogenase catalytic domain-containing protein [Mycobacteriales bacterium]|jgi:NADPH:quinone reductase-like Zn-dependent oxidoreductase
MRVLATTGDGTAAPVDAPIPVPGPRDVLVRVEAATINYVDRFVTSGAVHQLGLITHDRPVGLGWDAVGRVESVGPGVRGVSVGARVAGVRVADDTIDGAIAEFVMFPEADVALVPDTLTSIEAASIGMNALTAAQALTMFGVAGGRTLLVTGAAGGLGGLAIELAVAAGWTVTGLAREGDREFVESRKARLVTDLDGTTYDAVFDTAPLQFDDQVLKVALLPSVASAGTFCSVLSLLPLPDVPHATVFAVEVKPDGPLLASLLQRAAEGELTARIAGTVPLERAGGTLLSAFSGGVRGRWIVQPTVSS